MELVPSAVGPNPIEQRFKNAKVRTLRRRVESRGGEGPLRSRPEGQKNIGSARSIIRKRQRANKIKKPPKGCGRTKRREKKRKRKGPAGQKKMRKTGLEPVWNAPHAPQTCASASSATSAYRTHRSPMFCRRKVL